MKLVALFIACLLMASAALAVEVPKKIKLYGEIDIINSSCGAAGVTLSSQQFPCKIEKVRLGSQAAYAGLMPNDKVLHAEIVDNKVNLSIQRGSMHYAVKLNTSRDPIVATGTAVVPKVDTGISQNIDQSTALRILSQYDIVLIVDRSGSMASPVGAEDQQTSKWRWCQEHISGFAREIGPLLRGNQLKLITFNDKFETIPNCSPSLVESTFQARMPQGGTTMAPPLLNALEQRPSVGRPLLVVVLTDGIPQDPVAVENAIIEATKKMIVRDELKIRFLEIGAVYTGGPLLELLDDHLGEKGAKFDVVDYAGFDEVQLLGLAKSMVAQVHPPKRTRSEGTKEMASQLWELEAEIEELRKKGK